MAGFLFGVCSKCCDDDELACGTDCGETVTVDVSVAGYTTQLQFLVSDGFAFHSETGADPSDYFIVSAFLFCALVDGTPTWQLSVAVCWKNGADEGSEQWDGQVEADPDGCPPDGEIPLVPTFGAGVADVAAGVE